MANKKAKRSNGEGTIWLDNSRKRYRAQYFDNDGKRRGLSSASHSELSRKLRGILELRDKGMLPRQAKNVESLANYLYEWVSINEINWEFKTTERNKSDIRLHIEPLIGEKKITEISPTDIERLYKQLRTQHNLSDYSVLRIHVLLKTAFKRALILRRIYVNPMESVLKPVVRDKAKKTLSELDVSKLLELVDTKSEMWAALWWVTLLTGLRQGEVLALTWENLDLDSGKLTVTSQIQRQTGN
jgi:integrase